MSQNIFSRDDDKELNEILSSFERRARLSPIAYEIKERIDGRYVLFSLMNPTNRMFKILNETKDDISDDNPYKNHATIKRRTEKIKNRLQLAESLLLKTVLSESLTVTQHSFEDDFFSRYINSVSGFEHQIISNGNHIVYGRRGAGKSSLLAYLMHTLRKQDKPYAWIAMQTFSGRKDIHVVIDVLKEIIETLGSSQLISYENKQIINKLEKIKEEDVKNVELSLDRYLPSIKKYISSIKNNNESKFIFIDDLHVIDSALQPILLGKLYSICRDNMTFLKISGIELFTKTWDPENRVGMETKDDIQVIKLDNNLTMPDKSRKHIEEILDKHAVYCGLPNINYLCGNGVLDRLVWVSAGVPRDALNIFAQAMSYASEKDRQKVSITSVNAAVSVMADEKRKEIEMPSFTEIRDLFDDIRDFCVTKKRTNAFLVEIKNDNSIYQKIEKLIALRLLHIIHDGITPEEAGRRFKALILDYGFYVGARAAQSVDLFHKKPTGPIQVKELRKLPKFKLE